MEADLGLTKTSLGLFLTLHGLVYGISKFVNGFWSDGFNSRRYLIAGLTLCLLVNVLFGFVPVFAAWISGGETTSLALLAWLFGILWVLNGLFQGSGFPHLRHCRRGGILSNFFEQPLCFFGA